MVNGSHLQWAGIDWGDKAHALTVVDAQGNVVARRRIEHSAEGLDLLVAILAERGPIAGVAIEKTQHLVIDKLLEAAHTVYPVNPKVGKSWRECLGVDPAKNDPADGDLLAKGLRLFHDTLRPLRPDDPKTRELRLLSRAESGFIADRTALANRLKDCLKQYYPQALGWFSDFTTLTAADFVIAFPTPEALRRATDAKLIKFLAAHCIGLGPRWKQRLASRASGARWPSDDATVAARSVQAVALAKQLRTLARILTDYRQRIEALYGEHEDAAIFSSLPGAGPKLAPRLLTHFGTDRTRYSDAGAVAALSGSVPVTKESGGSGGARFRWACQKGFRNTLFLFAFTSLRSSLWARAFYDRARARGKTHPQALRMLGAKWLKIIYRMWVDRRPYDERLYMASLIRHQSPLIAWMQGAQNPGRKP
ncbi:IS110 family transposase [Planctomycetota bacterium]